MAPCVASEYSCRSIAKGLTARIAGLLSKTCLSVLKDLQGAFIDGTHPYKNGFTVNTILELAGEFRGTAFKPKYPDLVAALRQHGKNDTIPSAQSLGTILSKLNNVVLSGMDGWRLQKVGVVNHSVKWCVVPGASGAEGAISPGPGVVEGSHESAGSV